MALKWMSLLAFLGLVFCLLALIVRHALLANTPVTIGAQVTAVLLMIWARMTFGRRSFHAGANPTQGGLVTTGPYRYMRHPIYASILLFLTAAVVSHLEWMNILLLLLSAAAVAMRILCEEQLLIERYPEYKQYAAVTKRIIPFVL